jgi:hypothetical protein
MKLNRELPWNWGLGGLALGLVMFGFAVRCSANVYATNGAVVTNHRFLS